jgi:hypothetical protein
VLTDVAEIGTRLPEDTGRQNQEGIAGLAEMVRTGQAGSKSPFPSNGFIGKSLRDLQLIILSLRRVNQFVSIRCHFSTV